MTDYRSDPSDADRRSPMLGEAIDGAVRKLTTGIVIAGGLIGLGIYAHPEPRFQAFPFGDQIIRVDGKSGTIIACQGSQTCQLVLRKGQKLERIKRTDADASPQPALPQPALPKPAPATPPPAAPAAER
jgi:hypothetical protein